MTISQLKLVDMFPWTGDKDTSVEINASHCLLRFLSLTNTIFAFTSLPSLSEPILTIVEESILALIH
ncbi:hypothetical protein [Clostridium oryzae]|uniref:Uncharacterized protein n=1 Tax=Clostridium oryzae TaxID=1450648 RepID=A0A1V4IZN8_9CLOT|nr:hypothetical protein CLORY_02340 [Clostridium oryzae]